MISYRFPLQLPSANCNPLVDRINVHWFSLCCCNDVKPVDLSSWGKFKDLKEHRPGQLPQSWIQHWGAFCLHRGANLPISFKICKFSFSHDFYPFFHPNEHKHQITSTCPTVPYRSYSSRFPRLPMACGDKKHRLQQVELPALPAQHPGPRTERQGHGDCHDQQSPDALDVDLAPGEDVGGGGTVLP